MSVPFSSSHVTSVVSTTVICSRHDGAASAITTKRARRITHGIARLVRYRGPFVRKGGRATPVGYDAVMIAWLVLAALLLLSPACKSDTDCSCPVDQSGDHR